jgi:DNA-binding response OmpR family regulator
VPEPTRLRVLIVDDDESVLRLIEMVLLGTGFNVTLTAQNAKEALEKVDGCDVVLLDHHLPDGNGIDLLPALRGRPGQPSVILITAHGNESLAASALRLGAEDYLIKDGSLAQLLPQVLERVRRIRALREALAAAERDLVHAERLAAIGELNVTLHHTINNPLMTAFAETDLLLHTGEGLSDEQRVSLESIKSALKTIQATLQRVSDLRHDRTEEYVDGVSMIDLSRRTMPALIHRGDAVIFLPDEDIARVITSLLKHAGFAVDRVDSLEDLESAAAKLGMSVVVVQGSSGGGADPLHGFRPGEDRTYTLVALVAGEEAEAIEAGAELVVRLPFDPGSFVAELLAAMGKGA